MIRLSDIVLGLQRYAQRYRYLDVLASDVRDLESVLWYETPLLAGRATTGTAVPIRVEALEGGVLRFSLEAGTIQQYGPAAAGAAMGTAMGVSSKQEGGALAGALLGLLVGAFVGENVRMNRVMALKFEPIQRQWIVYDGPLLGVAKRRLAPG